MKVFKFDPETGMRGELLKNVKRASWASEHDTCYTGAKPVGFGIDAEATVHRDAGITEYSAAGACDLSYREWGTWVCFCLGCWHMGVKDDGSRDERWQWVILAPRED